MAISIATFAKNAHIDYMARTSASTRAVPTILISKPGEAKSSFVEGPMLDALEEKLFPGIKVDIDRNNVPDVLNGTHIHFSANNTVACLTDLAAMRDAPDYKGFLVPKKDGTSAYTMADLVAKERALYALGAKVVVLFLDEVLQADHLTQKALTDVMLNGRFGDYSLLPETWIVAASNRQQDHAGVNRVLSILQNRVNQVEVYLPVDVWSAHAVTIGLPAPLIGYAKASPGEVSIDQPPREGAFASWRSYTNAGLWLKSYKEAMGDEDPMSIPLGKEIDYAFEKVAGFVGQGLTVALAAFADRMQSLPKLEDIIRDPKGAMVPDRLDTSYAACQMLVHYATPKNVSPLWTYAERMPLELQTATASDLLKKGGGVMLNDPSLSRWLQKNRALIRNVMN